MAANKEFLDPDPAQKLYQDKQTQYSRLIYATTRNDKDSVARLIAAGAPVDDARYYIGPLFHAVQKNYTEIVHILLSAGAQVNKPPTTSVLYVAAANGNDEIVRMLITAGAIVDSGSGDESPLVAAVRYGRTEVVQTLVAAGATKDKLIWDSRYGPSLHPDADTETLLHYAAKNGNIDIVRILVEAGANIEATNTLHETPLELAYNNHHLDVVRYLITKSADASKIGVGVGVGIEKSMKKNAFKRRRHLFLEGGRRQTRGIRRRRSLRTRRIKKPAMDN